MNTRFRTAISSDSDAIANLHAESWRRIYRGVFLDEYLDSDLVGERKQVWSERLDHAPGNQFVTLATIEDQVVGFVCAFGDHKPKWGSIIDNIHVSEPYQRRGIGVRLMREVSNWLVSNYTTSGVYLWVSEPNEDARRFYESIGGRYVETVEGEDPSGGISRAVRCVWDSPASLFRQISK